MPSWVTWLGPLILGGVLVFSGWQARSWYEDAVERPQLERELQQAKDDRTAAEARERASEAARTREGLEADTAEASLRDQLRDAYDRIKTLPADDLRRGCLSLDAVRLYNAAIGATAQPVPGAAAPVPDAAPAGQPAP